MVSYLLAFSHLCLSLNITISIVSLIHPFLHVFLPSFSPNLSSSPGPHIFSLYTVSISYLSCQSSCFFLVVLCFSFSHNLSFSPGSHMSSVSKSFNSYLSSQSSYFSFVNPLLPCSSFFLFSHNLSSFSGSHISSLSAVFISYLSSQSSCFFLSQSPFLTPFSLRSPITCLLLYPVPRSPTHSPPPSLPCLLSVLPQATYKTIIPSP